MNASIECILTLGMVPLRAIESGANTLAEGFLFAVAAGLILGEQYRSTRNQTKRRDAVDDQLDELKSSVESLNSRLDALARQQEERFTEESMRYVYRLPHTLARPHQVMEMLTWALQT